MKNIFLTGPIQIGKSTIIKRVLEEMAGPIGGFMTKKVNFEEESIVNIMSLLNMNECETFAKFLPSNSPIKIEIYNEVLDLFGSNILRESLKYSPIIVLDELGFIERNALEFQKSVHKVLDSNNLVLGVIKPKDDKFLNSIRFRDDVEIIEVTKENRDSISNDIIKRLNLLGAKTKLPPKL